MTHADTVNAQWRYLPGTVPLLVGSSLISHCGPHFHDTYTIACMRSGRAEVRTRHQATVWDDGSVFICNPYEIHEGNEVQEGFGGVQSLVYDVCYPSETLMIAMLDIPSSKSGRIYFENIVLPRQESTIELGAIIADFMVPGARASTAAQEQALIDFFRRNRVLFRFRQIETDVSIWVSSAHAMLEEAVAEGTDVGDVLDRIGCSRSHLIRQFRAVTGITPGAYVRQLRLARARRLLCDGASIADIAADIGFSDQPHLTREFKRVNGTTPGKMLRDLLAQAEVAGLG